MSEPKRIRPTVEAHLPDGKIFRLKMKNTTPGLTEEDCDKFIGAVRDFQDLDRMSVEVCGTYDENGRMYDLDAELVLLKETLNKTYFVVHKN